MGMKISERFDLRCEIFCQILLMIEGVINGICYWELPVDEIFTEILKNENCNKLDFLMRLNKSIDSGVDFPCAWSESVYSTCMPLKKSEVEKLVGMGLTVGKSDSESQKRILTLYSEQFKKWADDAYEQRKKYFFPSRVSGVLLGGAIFILLL